MCVAGKLPDELWVYFSVRRKWLYTCSTLYKYSHTLHPSAHPLITTVLLTLWMWVCVCSCVWSWLCCLLGEYLMIGALYCAAIVLKMCAVCVSLKVCCWSYWLLYGIVNVVQCAQRYSVFSCDFAETVFVDKRLIKYSILYLCIIAWALSRVNITCTKNYNTWTFFIASTWSLLHLIKHIK